jgi:hypothetical protein
VYNSFHHVFFYLINSLFYQKLKEFIKLDNDAFQRIVPLPGQFKQTYVGAELSARGEFIACTYTSN